MIRIILAVVICIGLSSCDSEGGCNGGGTNCVPYSCSGSSMSYYQGGNYTEAPYTPTDLEALTNGTYKITLGDGTEIEVTLTVAATGQAFADCGDSALVQRDGLGWSWGCDRPEDSAGAVIVRVDWNHHEVPGWDLVERNGSTCKSFFLGASGDAFLRGHIYTFTWSSAQTSPGKGIFVYFDDRNSKWYMCSNGEATETWADTSKYYFGDNHAPDDFEYLDVSDCLEMTKQI